MRNFNKCVLGIFILSGYCSFAQPAVTLHKLDSLYQSCLDKGDNMLSCSYKYYDQMDSMLNVVYKMLRVRYDTNGRITLKNEESKWISKRDEYFKKVWSRNNGMGNGQDSLMSNTDLEAQYVRKRVLELINRLTY